MRTIKNNWLLAAAVSAVLSGYAGVSVAATADAVATASTPGLPALLELSSAMDTVSNATGAPSIKVKLWVLDANGNITSNDMDHTVTLSSSDQAVITDTTISFPAGTSYAEATVGVTGTIPLAGTGSTNLSAAFAETGSTGVATDLMLPINVVSDFMKVTNIMTGPVTAGVMTPAFNVTNSADVALEGQPLTVIHYDIGSSNPPAEVIGGIPNGLTPDTAGLGGAKGAFPRSNAQGNVSLKFFNASANPTTTSEYYIIQDPTGQFSDVRVDNINSDNQADIIPATAANVLYIKNGMVLNSFKVAASDTGFSGALPALTVVDAHGNMVTPFDLNVSSVDSANGGSFADGVLSYTSLTSDDITINFDSPAGATLNLRAVADGVQPAMNGADCLNLTMSGSIGSMVATALPTGAQFTGGISTIDTTIPQQNISIDAYDKVTASFTVTADSGANGEYGMLALYRPPVPNAPLFALTVQSGANGQGVGNLGFWDYNTANIPAYNSDPVSGSSTMNVLNDFEFGIDLMGNWFLAPGYTSAGSFVTCAANIEVE